MSPSKSDLRNQYLRQRQQLSKATHEQASHAISQHLIEHAKTKPYHSIAAYWPHQNEVSLMQFMDFVLRQEKIQLYLPQSISESPHYQFAKVQSFDNLIPGPHHIMEPPASASPPTEPLSLILVPGIAFDQSGYRLGYGKGIYDQLLEHETAQKIGICYQFQYIDQIPHEPHDIPMDEIITEEN